MNMNKNIILSMVVATILICCKKKDEPTPALLSVDNTTQDTTRCNVQCNGITPNNLCHCISYDEWYKDSGSYTIQTGYSLSITDLITNTIANSTSYTDYKSSDDLITGLEHDNVSYNLNIVTTTDTDLNSLLGQQIGFTNSYLLPVDVTYKNISEQNITGAYFVINDLVLVKKNYKNTSYLSEYYLATVTIHWTNTILNKQYDYTSKIIFNQSY